MPGFYRDTTGVTNQMVMYADNVDFSGSTAPVPKVTTNGQLLIGSTATPNIRVGTLTSPSGTITIGYSSPNITIDTNGSLVGETITGDTGGPLPPIGGNWNIRANSTAGATIFFNGASNTLSLGVTNSLGNTIMGRNAGNLFATTSTNNTGFGQDALSSSIIGFNSTAFGYQALKNENSSSNVAIGYLAGTNISDGSKNCCMGDSALSNTVHSINNTALGYHSMLSYAGSNVQGGNLACGFASLDQLVTGSNNIAFGNSSATDLTGSESNNIMIGNPAVTGDNNTIRIGIDGSGTEQQNKCFIAGIIGNTVSNSEFVTINISTGQLGVSSVGESNWSDTSGTFTAVAGNGYFITAASTPTLPASPSEGNIISFVCDTSSTVTITANTGQFIRIGSTISASAGTAASSTQGNSIRLVFRSSSSTWFALGAPEGTWTVT